jgi:hypothetical protein
LSKKSSGSSYLGIGVSSIGPSASAFVNSGGGEVDILATTVSANTWYLIAATFNASNETVSSYANNSNPSTNNSVGAIPTSLDTIGVGTLAFSNSFGSHITAWIAETAIWQTLLSTNEIHDMYYSRRPLSTYRQGSLWFYAPLAGLSSGFEPDLSAYSNNLALTGPPQVVPHPPVYLPRNPLRLTGRAVSSTTAFLPPRVIRPLTPHGQYDRWDYFP